MAEQREALELARHIVADETGKETASAWEVRHVDGRSMHSKFGDRVDSLVFFERSDAVDKAFSEVETYLNADITHIEMLVTVEPLGPWVPLARAVIALEETVERLTRERNAAKEVGDHWGELYVDQCNHTNRVAKERDEARLDAHNARTLISDAGGAPSRQWAVKATLEELETAVANNVTLRDTEALRWADEMNAARAAVARAEAERDDFAAQVESYEEDIDENLPHYDIAPEGEDVDEANFHERVEYAGEELVRLRRLLNDARPYVAGVAIQGRAALLARIDAATKGLT